MALSTEPPTYHLFSSSWSEVEAALASSPPHHSSKDAVPAEIEIVFSLGQIMTMLH